VWLVLQWHVEQRKPPYRLGIRRHRALGQTR
jgi:hypothetical protein